ncbi:MAG: hypothetical protein QM621_00325 [Aeromicrobium sp.]|uniref:hypothetical protein n=1 Tax=Aeromicrobium sp. TaxID=1871063 RepID=UPI0039E4B808
MIELIRRSPELIPELLSSRFGVDVSPGLSAAPFSEASRVVEPRTFHADAAFVFSDAGGEARLAVVFEMQRAWDPEKRWTWPLYVTHLENEARVDAALVVYCPDARAGARCREELGASGISVRVHRFVVTPDDLPLILDRDEAAESPELAVFGMLAHARESQARHGFPAYVAAMGVLRERLGASQATSYHDLVKAVMSMTVREEWSRYMTTTQIPRQYFSEDSQQMFEKGWRKGEAEGRAGDVLTVLAARGFNVPPEVRDRVTGTTDLARLDAWLVAAVTAESLDEVFGDEV